MLSQLQTATVRYAGKQVTVEREEFEKAIANEVEAKMKDHLSGFQDYLIKNLLFMRQIR